MEEHLVRNEGVASSNLVISTILLRSKPFGFELRRNYSEAECPYEAIPEFSGLIGEVGQKDKHL